MIFAVAWAESFASLDAVWSACELRRLDAVLLGRVSGAPESDALEACSCSAHVPVCGRTLLYVRESETRPASTCIETADGGR